LTPKARSLLFPSLQSLLISLSKTTPHIYKPNRFYLSLPKLTIPVFNPWLFHRPNTAFSVRNNDMSPIKCWATRMSGHANNRALKVTQLKLQLGLFGTTLGAPNDKLAFQITGSATNKEKKPSASSKQKTTPLSLAPFSKRRCSHATSSCRSITSKSPSLTWDDRDLCAFHLLLKDNSLDVCDLAFHVLYVRL